MKYAFIVNPIAGRGRGTQLLGWLKETVSREKIDHEIFVTQKRGEGIDLARHCNAEIVVAVGGDGTLNEVVNGILGSGKKMGVLPSGSGNDLVKSLAIPKDPSEAWKILTNCIARPIDVGLVTWRCWEGISQQKRVSYTRCFVNGLGIGFDAAVARKATKIRHFSGTLLYLAAVLLTLREYRSPVFDISAGDHHESRGRKLLIAVGNGACAGGGFYLTPRAQPDDGLLDMCVIDDLSLPGVLRLIPRVMKGRHLNRTGIVYHQRDSYTVSSTEPFAVHADGESLVGDAVSLEIGLHKSSLFVIVPTSASKC
jgi:YegS/Rv2252/BmrU family lipid kinase